jgi:hypothetical protein
MLTLLGASSSYSAFSAAASGGSMVVRMVGYAPDRILAGIEYVPGHYEPIGIDTVKLPEAVLSVPQFIIANAADNICGLSDHMPILRDTTTERR